MELLIAKKGGILFIKEWIYNEENRKGNYVFSQLNSEWNILGFLNEVVELEEGFTIRDWFKLVINYSDLQKLDNFFPEFIEEYLNCPENGCVDTENEINEIEIQKIINIDKIEDEKNECNIYIDISGNGNNYEGGQNIKFGIELLPLKNYLDVPLKLLPVVFIEDMKNRNEAKINYSLFELITSYIYEISFFGTPRKRDEQSDELKKSVEEIKSGKMKTYPFNFDEIEEVEKD